MARRPSWREADVYEIELTNGKRAYAVLLTSPLAAFFKGAYGGRPSDFGAVAFYAMVHHDALGRWVKVARTQPSHSVSMWFFKQDALSGKLRLRHFPSGEEKAASREDVRRHEPAGIWDPEQIEERLAEDGESLVEKMRAFAISTAPPEP